jgi:hypothetical protein
LHHGRLTYEGTLGELQASSGCEHLVEMFVDLMRS